MTTIAVLAFWGMYTAAPIAALAVIAWTPRRDQPDETAAYFASTDAAGIPRDEAYARLLGL